MAVEIYFFSGTGNSLHVARELQKRLPDATLIPVINLLDKFDVRTEADTVGFVFPLYFTTIPFPVRRFCEKLNIDSACYLFSVVTRLGTFSVANLRLGKILKKKGKKLNAHFLLKMAQNSPTGLKPGKGDTKWINKISKTNITLLESSVQKQIEIIVKTIISRENYPANRFHNPFANIAESVMHKLTSNMKNQVGFYADESCIHCGTCAKVCPSTTVRMHEGNPQWHEDTKCFYCFACFNFCPVQAILVKNKYTLKNGRYHHPSITADDIARQK
jgi:formate hydrogenlyase subunit 6/NADH:ubiquinone oxidoreductase subunit I